ncbi:MAG: DNA primase DnaG [Nanoarchaeota archaeon]
MAKIAQVSAKYIIHASISIQGVVDKPDVIGAVFGQTEGLLGADLELRELQRSGRIGRIEVNTEVKAGKTAGEIMVPSSLDKAETCIVAAALEIIQRIGPCNAKIKVETVEDVRVSRRQFVIERAKEILKTLMDDVMPDSQEIADEVGYSVRMMAIQEYGRERLPAGPAVEESDEVILVEGRADVLNMLKYGFKNVVAINGTSVPKTIIELCQKKTITVFVDGDRGGNLIVQELLGVAEIDFITRAPDGKEVEELTKKEIHKAIRSKIAAEQFRMEVPGGHAAQTQQAPQGGDNRRPEQRRDAPQRDRQERSPPSPPPSPQVRPQPVVRAKLSDEEKKAFSGMLDDLIGTRGAYVLDSKLNILGKVPVTEMSGTIKSLKGGIYAIIFDGTVDNELVTIAERSNIRYLIGMDKTATNTGKVIALTADAL